MGAAMSRLHRRLASVNLKGVEVTLVTGDM